MTYKTLFPQKKVETLYFFKGSSFFVYYIVQSALSKHTIDFLGSPIVPKIISMLLPDGN